MKEPNLDGLKIVEAFAEWDDPDAFRVFLRYEGEENEDGDIREETVPLEADYSASGEMAIEQRLYWATMYANPKDFVGRVVDRDLGWERKPPAERAAKACNAELERIAKGEPQPDRSKTAMDVQIATLMMPRKAKTNQ